MPVRDKSGGACKTDVLNSSNPNKKYYQSTQPRVTGTRSNNNTQAKVAPEIHLQIEPTKILNQNGTGMIRKNMIKIQEQMDNSSEQIQNTTSTNEKI